MLSPVGKVLHLDLASMQKTRGSVEKVKIQVDLTQERPHHVWLGFNENQDVNGDGKWLVVVYEDLPTFCLYYRHLGHEEYHCVIKKIDKRKKEKQRKIHETKMATKLQQEMQMHMEHNNNTTRYYRDNIRIRITSKRWEHKTKVSNKMEKSMIIHQQSKVLMITTPMINGILKKRTSGESIIETSNNNSNRYLVHR